jgi:DNA modification methylase
MSWDVNRVQIIQGVAERDCPAPDSVDLVFTSPPYFSNEKYKGGEQSFQYQTYEDWLGKFLTLMVKNAYSCLHDGGYMGVNIQNVTLRGKRYPLVTDLDKVARSIGFKRYARYRYPLSYMGKHRPAEPILIYQKQVSELVRDDVEWDLV